MSTPHKNFLIPFLTLLGFTFSSISAFAVPSAKDIFASCEKQTRLNCNTQHLIYQTTTVYGHGSTPVTYVQTIEIFKKKPGLMKTIMDLGVTKQTVIAKNGYYYLLDDKSHTYFPVKAPLGVTDPFQEITTDISNFDSSTVEANGTNYTITLRGGKIPNMKVVDHLEVSVDGSTYTIGEVKGIGKTGAVLLDVTMQYEQIGNIYQVKSMQTQTNVGAYSIQAEMQVLKDEVNTPIDDSVFATQ